MLERLPVSEQQFIVEFIKRISASYTANTNEKITADCTVGLRGILADCEDMSVDKFLARKRADKGLDL